MLLLLSESPVDERSEFALVSRFIMPQATLYLIHSTTVLQALLDALDVAILRLAGCNWWANRLIEIY
jgi:hypothetical protein